MAGILDNMMSGGLLGMGGLQGAMGGQGVPQGLLEAGYDPATLRKMQIKRALLQGGAAMMSMGPSQYPVSFAQQLGTGLSAGLLGADQARDDYTQQTLLGQQLQDRKFERGRQAKQDAWTNTANARQMSQWDEEDAAKKQKRDYINKTLMSPLTGVPVQNMGQANMLRQMGDYDAAGQALMSRPEQEKLMSVGADSMIFDPNTRQYIPNPNARSKPPQVETFFDEKTGQQYKAQFNPEKNTWERVGGSKAPEGGITVTNPDGSTVQVGGTGNRSTEADRRAGLLAQQIVEQTPAIMSAFDSLASTQNTAGNMLPGGRAIMSPDAQVAEDGLKNVVANWLYLVSGATATDDEVARQFAMVRPNIMDSPEAIAAKKARLQSIVDTMKMRAGMQQQPEAPADIDALIKKYGG